MYMKIPDVLVLLVPFRFLMPIWNVSVFIIWTKHCRIGDRKLKCSSVSVCWENKNTTMPHTERFSQPGKQNKTKQHNSPTVPCWVFLFGAPRKDPSLYFPLPSAHINIFNKASQDCDFGTYHFNWLFLFVDQCRKAITNVFDWLVFSRFLFLSQTWEKPASE